MKFQTFSAILLLVILGEFIQVRAIYKWIKPYKYYRPMHRDHKPRWHNFSRPPKYQHFKKRPPKPHYHPPNGAWKGSRYGAHHIDYEQPYTIQIELPKIQHGYSQFNGHHHRNYIPETVWDYDDDDYLDENEIFVKNVLWTRNKKVRVQIVKDVKPKLKIKISRDDDIVKVTNSPTSPLGGSSFQRNSSWSRKRLNSRDSEAEWMPGKSVPSFPKALRGA